MNKKDFFLFWANGPLNDFLHSNSFLKFNLFADDDDSTITCSFPDFNKQIVQNKLNEELGRVHHWLESKKYNINHEISNFQICSYRKKLDMSPMKFRPGFTRQTPLSSSSLS